MIAIETGIMPALARDASQSADGAATTSLINR
jgi:hypothetical protein